jgi:hypothetical protein
MTNESQRDDATGEIRIEVTRNKLIGGIAGNISSIVFDTSGAPLDDILEGLCIDVGEGKATIRWGKGFGDHFVPWRIPFSDVEFCANGLSFRFVTI